MLIGSHVTMIPPTRLKEVVPEHGSGTTQEKPNGQCGGIVFTVVPNGFSDLDFNPLKAEYVVVYDVKWILEERANGKLLWRLP